MGGRFGEAPVEARYANAGRSVYRGILHALELPEKLGLRYEHRETTTSAVQLDGVVGVWLKERVLTGVIA